METIAQLPPEVQDVVWALALDLTIVAVAVVALLTTAKQVFRLFGHGAKLDSRVGQVALEVAPLLLGPALAIVPGLLGEFDWPLRLVLGLIAGFLSPGIYGALKKRLPGVMASKKGRAEAGEPSKVDDDA